MRQTNTIAVVIPAYNVVDHILGVLGEIGPEVSRIFVVDDACPQNSGAFVEENSHDPRVTVVRHEVNQGVGGAMMTGYRAALETDVDIIVKVDGDGQMDPKLISTIVDPIALGEADYVKGNRFFDLDEIHRMPRIRILGNAALSFVTKLSTGYWDLFDPTNGFTAIHRDALRLLPLKKISKRYFFETDMIFQLGLIRAVVADVPINARYGDEVSGLKIRNIFTEFLMKHSRNLVRRIFYNYYLRGMSVASIELPLGILLLLFGGVYGIVRWTSSAESGVVTPAGSVMLSAMPILIGIQLILAFFAFDFASVPRRVIHRRAHSDRRFPATEPAKNLDGKAQL
jgi:dolichol-phosphate mannosyltransferase